MGSFGGVLKFEEILYVQIFVIIEYLQYQIWNLLVNLKSNICNSIKKLRRFDFS